MFRRLCLAILLSAFTLPLLAHGEDPTTPAETKPNAQPGAGAATDPSSGTKKTFLWEVKSGTNTLYLFGSPGLGNSDLYPVSFWAEAAYTRAQVLAVESDLSDETRFAKEAADMFYPKGDTLEQHISKPLFEEVYDFHAAQGLPFTASNQMKPYALAIGLMNKEAKTVGLDGSFDAPFYFIAKAQADNKPVQEVEGVPQELRTLEALPLPLQEEMLKSAVEQAAKSSWAEALQAEVAAWKSGDVDYYQELDLKSYATMEHGVEIRRRLVEDRHPAIADKVAGYLKTGKVYFVILSAAHFVGPNTLLAELEKRGFKIQRL